MLALVSCVFLMMEIDQEVDTIEFLALGICLQKQV